MQPAKVLHAYNPLTGKPSAAPFSRAKWERAALTFKTTGIDPTRRGTIKSDYDPLRSPMRG